MIMSEMQSYAGRYGAGEPGPSAEVTAGEGGVALRFGRGSLHRLELPEATRDVFRRGSMIARFHRNAAGEVVAFSYSDPLLPRLLFTRPAWREGLAARPAS